MRSGMRSKAELAEVDAVRAQRHGWSDPNRRISAIDGHRVGERNADVNDLHFEARAWRRISATLQAWAMQPTGRKGGSGSKISLIVPSPASAGGAVKGSRIRPRADSRACVAICEKCWPERAARSDQSAINRSALYHSALISIGLPRRGVTTQSWTRASIQVSA